MAFSTVTAIRIAQEVAQAFVMKGEILPIPNHIPPDLTLQRACYVTIYEKPGRRLRAMYGSPLPAHATLADEIIANTITAIQAHPRGGPIRRPDLKSLVYSVAVLGPLERITSEHHLDPKAYGLFITTDQGKSAVMLPDRVGVETGQEQISTAWREAGITTPGREAVTMYRFSVTHFD